MPVITSTAFPVMPDFTITPPGVEKLLSELEVNKAAGPDGIPSRLLKILAPQVAPALSFIFNSSLQSGTLPPLFTCRQKIFGFTSICGPSA